MTACIDATGNLQLQLSEIALAFGVGETRRDLLRDGDRAGVGKAAIIQPRASDDVADEIEIGRSQSGRIERFPDRSEEHTSELQSLMRTSYAVVCLKKKTN